MIKNLFKWDHPFQESLKRAVLFNLTPLFFAVLILLAHVDHKSQEQSQTLVFFPLLYIHTHTSNLQSIPFQKSIPPTPMTFFPYWWISRSLKPVPSGIFTSLFIVKYSYSSVRFHSASRFWHSAIFSWNFCLNSSPFWLAYLNFWCMFKSIFQEP